jgi:hypothetical protein
MEIADDRRSQRHNDKDNGFKIGCCNQ